MKAFSAIFKEIWKRREDERIRFIFRFGGEPQTKTFNKTTYSKYIYEWTWTKDSFVLKWDKQSDHLAPT